MVRRCPQISVLPIGTEAELRSIELAARVPVSRFTPVSLAKAAITLGVSQSHLRKLCQRHRLQYLCKAPPGMPQYLALEQVLEYKAERKRLGYR